MARVVPAEEYGRIIQIISEHPEGIGIAALHAALSRHFPNLHRRTLQRRLQRLKEEGRIVTEGESIALVYKSGPGAALTSEPGEVTVSAGEAEIYKHLQLSHEGEIIRRLVGQPLMQRRPVGYHRAFLEGYEPGSTFYLPETLRVQLHEIGRTPAGERPAGTYAREILNRLLIDLSWASSRLEGNTYNRLDTENLIEFGREAEGKDKQETQMILNHKAAIEMIVDEADQVGFNPFTLLNLHAILAENLLADEDAGGRLRRRPVNISGSVYQPIAMPQVLEEYFRLLQHKAAAIPDPFEQAFFAMVQLPYLQPFEDVNKRVSRLSANIPLIRDNLCPLSFVDVPERAYVDGILGIYEFNQVDLLRDVFVWAYERSCQRYLAITQTMAEPDPLRLRYRQELIRSVQEIVRNLQAPSAHNLRRLADEGVPEKDREAFQMILEDTLHHLHEGNVARYRLKLSEFLAWKVRPGTE